MHQLLAFGMPGIEEWMVIAIIGVIVFGKRLPEVGKNLGKGIVEFKKGLKGIEDDAENATSTPVVRKDPPMIVQAPITPPDAYKFDPVTGQPLQETPVIPPGAKFDPYTGKPIEEEQIGASR